MAVRIDEAGLCELFPEINEISDQTIRKGVIDIWLKTARDCKWERFEDVPKNIGSEKYRRLTDHIRGVTMMAMSLAEIARTRTSRSLPALIAVGGTVSRPRRIA